MYSGPAAFGKNRLTERLSHGKIAPSFTDRGEVDGRVLSVPLLSQERIIRSGRKTLATREEWEYLRRITWELVISGLKFESCMGIVVWGAIAWTVLTLGSMLARIPR